MTHIIHKKGERGFTLVELAIVLVIIGLLIGGVLQGRQLIHNTQVTRISSDVSSYDAAFTTFYGTFGTVPGDLFSPDTRIPNCSGPCVPGGTVKGSGFITQTPAAPKPSGTEAFAAWHQLINSDLIAGGLEPNNTNPAFGSGLPKATLGGGTLGFEVGYSPAGLATDFKGIIGDDNLKGGHYILLKGAATAGTDANAAGGALVPPLDAQAVDRARDDSRPDTGTVRAFGGETCGIAGTEAGEGYITSTRSPACGLFMLLTL